MPQTLLIFAFVDQPSGRFRDAWAPEEEKQGRNELESYKQSPLNLWIVLVVCSKATPTRDALFHTVVSLKCWASLMVSYVCGTNDETMRAYDSASLCWRADL